MVFHTSERVWNELRTYGSLEEVYAWKRATEGQGQQFASTTGERVPPFAKRGWRCSMNGSSCRYNVKCIHRNGSWTLLESGVHNHDPVVRNTKGLNQFEKNVVDGLWASDKFTTVEYAMDQLLKRGVESAYDQVQNRLNYLRRHDVRDLKWDGTLGGLQHSVHEFIKSCTITSELDKPIANVVVATSLGRHDIVVTTTRLLTLLASRKSIHIDGTHGILPGSKQKVLTVACSDEAGKYFTVAYMISNREDLEGYTTLLDTIAELLEERCGARLVPNFIVADGLKYASRLLPSCRRIMCSFHLRQILEKQVVGKDRKEALKRDFCTLRRCTDVNSFEKCVEEFKDRYPTVRIACYLEGELSCWARARLLAEGVSPQELFGIAFSNNPCENGNHVLKARLKETTSQVMSRLKILISKVIPELSSRLQCDPSRVC
jgi:hypothetical protein